MGRSRSGITPEGYGLRGAPARSGAADVSRCRDVGPEQDGRRDGVAAGAAARRRLGHDPLTDECPDTGRGRCRQRLQVVAALEEHDPPAGRNQLDQGGGEVRVVARGQAEVGDRVGPMGVEAGRDEQPGGLEGRRERCEDLVDPRLERIAGGPRRQRQVDGRAPPRAPRPPRAGPRCPDRAGTGGSWRRRRARRTRTRPGCRCRGGRRSRRSAPAPLARRAPPR